MQTLDALVVKNLLERLGRLRPESRAVWGRMNAHQMLCHLNDSFDLAMNKRAATESITIFGRTVMRWVALHTALKLAPRHSDAPRS